MASWGFVRYIFHVVMYQGRAIYATDLLQMFVFAFMLQMGHRKGLV